MIPKPKTCVKERKTQARISNNLNKPRTSRNTRSTSVTIGKDTSSKYGQTNVLYHHGNKTIKVTDKPENEQQSVGKGTKGPKQR